MTDTDWVARRKDPTMKKDESAGATPRRHDAAFKVEAVRLWKASGDAAEKVARVLTMRSAPPTSFASVNDWYWPLEKMAPSGAQVDTTLSPTRLRASSFLAISSC